MGPKFIQILSPKLCQQITKKLVFERDNPKYFFHDDQIPDALSIKTENFPSITKIYKETRPPVDLSLRPTNWYGRMYLKGNELKRHYDDPHCDHSITITVGYSHENWQIWIDGHPYEIETGWGVYYRGCDMEHWRYRLEWDWHIQFFFHYVEA
jgi:hypothetical protein